MKYLLDTNVWIAVLRKTGNLLTARFQLVSPIDIQICSVVIAELHHGCLRSAKPAANRAAVDSLLAPYVSLPFDDSAADKFATARWQLERSGQMIGPYDLQIAAIALANQCTLVTHNTAEFNRVAGLTIEDWQTP